MNPQVAERIRRCPNLPSLPAIALQVLDLVHRQDVDIAEIARAISKDAALSGKILRTVNSSFYARAQAVGTISHALVILGLQSVKTLVLGFSLVTNLSKAKPRGFDHLAYWRRSIYGATAARAIAAKVGVVQQEEAFLAALLKDIGMLVLDQVMGDAYAAACAAAADHDDLVRAERKALGVDHAEAGGLLAQQWKLPPLLAVPIAAHHAPQKVEDPALRKMADLASLSSRCADVFVGASRAPSGTAAAAANGATSGGGGAAGPAAAIARARQSCQELYGMSEADADALLDDIGKRTREVAPLFEINLEGTADYEAILKKANEALVEITLQSQQQATLLEQQASTLQQQASTLAEQNQQLKQKAETDGLTGLANRARFDEFLADQWAAAARSGRPLSLLLMDLDKFKSVNDEYGHPAGDRVLQYLGRLLATAARAQDLAARYGGEEMVLVLPATAKATAAAIAESIRRALAAKPVPLSDGRTVAVTASIGVAAYEPPSPLAGPAHLLKAADLAVYAAKKSGRNCVKVFALTKPAALAALAGSSAGAAGAA